MHADAVLRCLQPCRAYLGRPASRCCGSKPLQEAAKGCQGIWRLRHGIWAQRVRWILQPGLQGCGRRMRPSAGSHHVLPPSGLRRQEPFSGRGSDLPGARERARMLVCSHLPVCEAQARAPSTLPVILVMLMQLRSLQSEHLRCICLGLTSMASSTTSSGLQRCSGPADGTLGLDSAASACAQSRALGQAPALHHLMQCWTSYRVHTASDHHRLERQLMQQPQGHMLASFMRPWGINMHRWSPRGSAGPHWLARGTGGRLGKRPGGRPAWGAWGAPGTAAGRRPAPPWGGRMAARSSWVMSRKKACACQVCSSAGAGRRWALAQA